MRGTALAFATLLFFAPVARAQTEQAGIAGQLFDAGRDLMKRGDYAAACPKLLESARLEPRVGTLARLAECEEKIGHVASARGHWKDAVDLARAQKDNRAAHAEQELARVDAIVPRLVLRAAAPSVPGFTVQLDNVAIGAESLGVPLPIDPGAHTVVASAREKTSWTTTVDAKANAATITVQIPALADVPRTIAIAPIVRAMPAPTAVVTRRPLAIVGVATAIGGVVLAGAGFAFGSVATSLRGKALDEGCQDDGTCFGGVASNDFDSARAMADVATAFVIAGAVVAVAGVTLFLIAPKKTTPLAVHVGLGGIEGVF